MATAIGNSTPAPQPLFSESARFSLRNLLQQFVACGLAGLLIGGQLSAQAAELTAPAQDAAQATAPAAPADTSPDALDHLLAPIALYPDALLMQVLAASVDSQEVLDAGNWLLENKSLEGPKLDEAAKKVGFGAAMTALLHFPDVVDMMCTQLDWTKQLGAAFQADQAGVLASVQRLRAQAVQYGSLKTTPQQQVVTQTDNGKQVIVIQPANPQVVYVPQYNPQTVYVAPPPSGPSTGDVVAASIISFGVGMAVGSLFSSNNYYYPRWGYGGVYYGGRPWVPAHYAYRPIYGPHYRPAYGYRPPANYPYHRANYNNNYYNNYRGGNNYHGGNNTININNRPNNGYNGNRPGNGNNNKPGNGNGYNGNNNNRPGNGNNNRPVNGNNGNNNRPGNGSNNRPGNGSTGGYNKPTTRPASGGNNTPRPAPDRGYAKPTTQPARPTNGAGASRPPSQQTRPVSGGGASRPPSQQARPAPSNNRQASAFSSGGGSGRSVKAASQRGAASAGGRKR